MKLPVLRPGDLVVPVPIIQGAMAGTDAYRLNKITTVRELMRESVAEAEQVLT